jgi:predicted  nucleic acid-binding Zn-ribbon protein
VQAAMLEKNKIRNEIDEATISCEDVNQQKSAREDEVRMLCSRLDSLDAQNAELESGMRISRLYISILS